MLQQEKAWCKGQAMLTPQLSANGGGWPPGQNHREGTRRASAFQVPQIALLKHHVFSLALPIRYTPSVLWIPPSLSELNPPEPEPVCQEREPSDVQVQAPPRGRGPGALADPGHPGVHTPHGARPRLSLSNWPYPSPLPRPHPASASQSNNKNSNNSRGAYSEKPQVISLGKEGPPSLWAEDQRAKKSLCGWTLCVSSDSELATSWAGRWVHGLPTGTCLNVSRWGCSCLVCDVRFTAPASGAAGGVTEMRHVEA